MWAFLIGLVQKWVINFIKNANKSFLIIEKIKKYRKCPPQIINIDNIDIDNIDKLIHTHTHTPGPPPASQDWWARTAEPLRTVPPAPRSTSPHTVALSCLSSADTCVGWWLNASRFRNPAKLFHECESAKL